MNSIYDGWDDFEKVYNDKTAWVFFDGVEGETVGVYRRCPVCAKYISTGDLLINGLGTIKLVNWKCKKHGEVQPYWDRNFGEV